VRVLASSVLVAEAFLVIFATIVAINLSGVNPGTAWAVGAAFSVACLLLCGLLRYRWAYVAGSVVQVALLASGLVVSTMVFLGLVFGALWVVALRVGSVVDAARAERAATGQGR
jgi:hypothetical protein